jgi:beta-phosphoglucomutase-like phosphatase (HAD superfamily)
MTAVMKNACQTHLTAYSEAQCQALADEVIYQTTGLPVAGQMAILRQTIIEKGGGEFDHLAGAATFQNNLQTLVLERHQKIGGAPGLKQRFRVPGSLAFLRYLSELPDRPILTVVSASSAHDVQADLAILGLGYFFRDRIFAPVAAERATEFSKLAVFSQLLTQFQPSFLIAFGDAPTEIAAATRLGGLAVGIVYNPNQEADRLADPQRLRAAGACLIVDDFEDPALMTFIQQITVR